MKQGSGAHLVESILAAVADVDNLDDLRTEPGVEHVALRQLGLEVRAASENEASHIHLVISDEVLHGEFGDLADVVVALLVTETRETERGLTTAAVLLGEVDGELVDDLACVARDGAEERAVAVHDNEAELGVRLEQLLKRLGMEFVVAQVERTGAGVLEIGDQCIDCGCGRTY